jgi:hypothetical protein
MQTPFVMDCIKEPEKTKAAQASGGYFSETRFGIFNSAHRAICSLKAPWRLQPGCRLGIIRALLMLVSIISAMVSCVFPEA